MDINILTFLPSNLLVSHWPHLTFSQGSRKPRRCSARGQPPEAQSRADRGRQRNDQVWGCKQRMHSTVPGRRDSLVVTHWALEPDCLDLITTLALTNDVTESKFLYLSELQFSHL